MIDFDSDGMILFANVEFDKGSFRFEHLRPPKGSQPGDRVYVDEDDEF